MNPFFAFWFPCGICDRRTRVTEQHMLTPYEIPHKDILKATGCLQRRDRVMSECRNYPRDADGFLDSFVLSVHEFDESDPRMLHVCK